MPRSVLLNFFGIVTGGIIYKAVILCLIKIYHDLSKGVSIFERGVYFSHVCKHFTNGYCVGIAVLLPTSQPSEDARLARRQRIVPREEWRMRKNSRSSSEKCNCKA